MSGGRFSGKLDPKVNPFDDDYLADIIGVTALAWARIEQPGPQEIEDRITYRLAGLILNDAAFAEIPYLVVPQHIDVGPTGELIGRHDLRFTYRHSQRDYFVFEAKRLHVTYPGGSFSNEYRTYAGTDGMMAFIEGQYSSAARAGGMIGYVMDGRTDQAWTGLGHRIEALREQLKMTEDTSFTHSGLSHAIEEALEGTHLGETQHTLDLRSLRLLHLLLPVRS